MTGKPPRGRKVEFKACRAYKHYVKIATGVCLLYLKVKFR